MRIACIGSTGATPEQGELFRQIGRFIVSGGDYITTGNAEGSDFYFADGGNSIKPENVLIYLPWPDYNKQFIHPKNKVLLNPKNEWFELTAPFHPIFNNLKKGAQRMMSRNYGIVHKADKLIALLNHRKQGFGGTGQGWRIAESLDIPRLDLNNKSFDEVVEFLES